jgi:hypothetical protein
MLQLLHGVNTAHCSLLRCITFPFICSSACDVCDWRHLPSCCSVSSMLITFKPLHPERSPDKFTISQAITIIQSILLHSPSLSLPLPTQSSKVFFFPLTLSHNSGGFNSWSGRCSHLSGCYSVCNLFFHFGGCLPLHKAHFLNFLIFCNPLEIPTVHFMISSSMMFL